MNTKKTACICLLLLIMPLMFSESKAYLTITDNRDRQVVIKNEPLRIISLAPNITEIIYKLGASDKLIARTDYCDYPKDVKNKPSIGSLFQPSIEKIVELNPDLIIASTHFQTELLNKLTDLKLIVVIIDELGSINGVYKNIRDVGDIVNRRVESEDLVNLMKKEISTLTKSISGLEKPSVYYVIDYGEYGDYTAGGGTFISDLIELAGGDNIAKDSIGWNYSLEKIISKNPSILICSMYYNKKKGLYEAAGYSRLPAVRDGRVYEIDNNLLDRQGPRVVEGLRELIKILHPESL